MQKLIRWPSIAVFGLALVPLAHGARAEPAVTSATQADPTFGNRTDKPDGSVAMTIGRRLPTEWEAKVGTDVNLAGPGSTVASENFLRGDSPAQSTGSIWGNLTMPGIAPTLEARVDAGADQRKVGAALSRSLPIGRDLSVTVRNYYSISQSVTDHEFANAALPLITSPLSPATGLDGSATWATDQSVRLSIGPSGTAVSAGEVRSSTDDQWHSKFTVEQQLFGPLKVTTSVEDAGGAASKKSITAAFKRVW